MSGIHSPSSWLLLRAWITSLAPSSGFTDTDYLLGSVQLHSIPAAVPWWLSHDTGISKMLGSPVTTGLHFRQKLLRALFQGLQPCHTEPSLSCSPWFLHAFKTSIAWVAPTLPSSDVNVRGQPWPPMEHRQLCADFEETLPRRFHLDDSGLFLTTAICLSSSWPASIFPVKKKVLLQ